jgi:hypothetical protein
MNISPAIVKREWNTARLACFGPPSGTHRWFSFLPISISGEGLKALNLSKRQINLLAVLLMIVGGK